MDYYWYYRPPNQNSKYFLNSLSSVMDQYNSDCSKIVCIGDFSLDTKHTDMDVFMSEHNLINLIITIIIIIALFSVDTNTIYTYK